MEVPLASLATELPALLSILSLTPSILGTCGGPGCDLGPCNPVTLLNRYVPSLTCSSGLQYSFLTLMHSTCDPIRPSALRLAAIIKVSQLHNFWSISYARGVSAM
jgi:hypothetical protein